MKKNTIIAIATIIVAIIIVCWSIIQRENCRANGGIVVENYSKEGGFLCIYED